MHNWYTQLHKKQLQKEQSLERLPLVFVFVGLGLFPLGIIVGIITNSYNLMMIVFLAGLLFALASLVWFAVASIGRHGGISGVISIVKSEVLPQFTQRQQAEEEAQPTNIQAEKNHPHQHGF